MSKEHLLVTLGKGKFNKFDNGPAVFVKDPEANILLNDFDNFPHAYVLACCTDRQVVAEVAWMIPSKLRDIFGDFSIEKLSSISLDDYIQIFNEHKLHRFNNVMAKVFYSAVQKIIIDYNGDASNIWKGEPSSAAVVYRFLQFEGVGIKIATMAANILARDFKIPFSDYYSIDISLDIHIRRVIRRSGLVSNDANEESIIYKARELYPEFPGIIDYPCWGIGRTWCRPRNPNCEECIIKSDCLKNIG